ncbi:capsular polysaccharide biosynthesis protein [Polymorphobacter multimanifer]|uniref:polysaccharide biosynthesis/export family protein n=1 Tax=Polymorphobacter multimanifer TaxID=1070431 RepID=UPI001663F3B2|nr:polysaccharide biosynthesis/export family protein [Polymorphobacter multimanifer]GGI78757.1 capsular polysaccharide biosynthesis protein [Polymorphobacter multimanifer]
MSNFRRNLIRFLVAGLSGTVLAGCQPFGPSRGDIDRASRIAPQQGSAAIEVIQVGPTTAPLLAAPAPWPAFADVLTGAQAVGTVVGVGDALEVTIWEAPPATLFGAPASDTRIGSPISTARPTSLPELVVGPDTTIGIPFAGAVPAAGRTLREIETEIVRRLRGRATAPQALVRVVRNATANVTVVGDVNQSTRLPLTPRGERLLDAIAQAGGVKAPVNLSTIQVTRGANTYRMALSDIIERNENNIVLARDDIVTALFQPYSFTVLGASGRNDEVRFEAFGITLAQALGRIGGLQDGRADPRGVFLFRLAPPAQPGGPLRPIIYSFDLKDPSVYFLAQQLRVEDRDLIYITNSPVAELQRFVGIISSTILPIATVGTVVR